MTDVYVYYRVLDDNAARLHGKVRSIQGELAKRFHVTSSLKRRTDEPRGVQTWMEIYGSVPDDFLAALSDAVREAQLPIEGERHIEIFTDIPCA